jgi:hypothetical protein
MCSGSLTVDGERGVKTPANVGTTLGVDDNVAQRAMGDVTFEVPPKLLSLGAVSAVLLPKAP